ncbi:MAG: hypothetical protein JEY96_16705 [Bacteroidales bacterium]|nr:hypothetical protein [Bacteroidales bacterium]
MEHSNSEIMDTTTRKKLKIVLIAFLILLIPLGFAMKILYGIHLNDKALNTYWGAHIGISDKEAASQAISEFDKAKKFNKRNPIIYINQARLYGTLHQYDKAIKTIEEYIEIKPNFAYGYLMLGVFHEQENETKRAQDYYLRYRSLKTEKYSKRTLDKEELKTVEFEELMDFYLLNDTVSFKKRLIDLETKYPNDWMINGVKLQQESESRKEIILGLIGMTSLHNIVSEN